MRDSLLILTDFMLECPCLSPIHTTGGPRSSSTDQLDDFKLPNNPRCPCLDFITDIFSLSANQAFRRKNEGITTYIPSRRDVGMG